MFAVEDRAAVVACELGTVANGKAYLQILSWRLGNGSSVVSEEIDVLSWLEVKIPTHHLESIPRRPAEGVLLHGDVSEHGDKEMHSHEGYDREQHRAGSAKAAVICVEGQYKEVVE